MWGQLKNAVALKDPSRNMTKLKQIILGTKNEIASETFAKNFNHVSKIMESYLQYENAFDIHYSGDNKESYDVENVCMNEESDVDE